MAIGYLIALVAIRLRRNFCSLELVKRMETQTRLPAFRPQAAGGTACVGYPGCLLIWRRHFAATEAARALHMSPPYIS
jgi:hypothetical protein